MLMRWFVVQVPVSNSDSCIIVGNCKTQGLAQKVVDTLEEQSDSIFRVVGPITETMLQGKMTEEDLELVTAEIERAEMLMHGGRIH